MTQANSTNKAPILRDMYGDSLQEMTWSEEPYRRDLKKSTEGFGGGPNAVNGRVVVVRTGQAMGTAHQYDRALANKNPASEARFTVLPKRIYQPYQLDGLYIRQARGKPEALIRGVEDEQKSSMRTLNKVIDRTAWGDAGGSLGQIDSAVSLATNQLTFRNARALFGQYLKGAKIVFSVDNGAGVSPAGLRGTGPDSPTILTILSVNERTNTVTIGDVNGAAAILSSVPAITVNDFVFLDGTYTLAPTGKRGWNPITEPTAGDSFLGVDRSVAVSYLSGWRQLAGASMELTAIDAMTMGAQAETGTGRLYSNTFDWSRMVKEVGVKYVRDASDGKQGVGAKGIELYGPQGTCTMFGSNLVPQGNAWMGSAEADMMLSEGPCPDVLDEDDNGPLRKVANADAYQGDLGGYYNFLPNDDSNKMGPGAWVIITWPAV